MKQKNTMRNSSIELLRIVAMFMIVLCHYATHGGFTFEAHELSISRFWWCFIEMGGNVGVDVFVLISGYYLVLDQSKIVKGRRVLKTWGQLVFYSLCLFALGCFAGLNRFGAALLIKSTMPVSSSIWWFASAWFVLYLIHPYINVLLCSLEKKDYQRMLLVVLMCWCVIPTVTTFSFQSNGLIWFVTLYCVAGYIKLYGLKKEYSYKKWLGIWVLFSLVRYLSCIVLVICGTRWESASAHALHFYGQQSILTLICSVALVMVFVNYRVTSCDVVNFIASAMFGVYLIHDHRVMRTLLWEQLFQNNRFQHTAIIIPVSIVVALSIVAVCTLIDLLRQITVEKVYLWVMDCCIKRIRPFFERKNENMNNCEREEQEK